MTFRQRMKNVSLDCLQIKKSSQTQTVFYCCGFVVSDIANLSCTSGFDLRHGMSEDKICSFNDVESAQEAFDDDDVNSNSNVKMPFSGIIPEGLFIGKTIQIKGKITEIAERFSINLVTDETKGCDIAFHFNPRFDRRIVVRNTRRRGSWGVEEIACNRKFPFFIGRNFSLTVFVADGQFMVAVNNIHFCSYNWKIPLQNILSLQIEGDITLFEIVYLKSTKYPSLPTCRLPRVMLPNHNKYVKVRKNKDGIVVGTEVVICGQVKLLPHAFYINLQVGSTIVPHPIIPLHLNLRLCRPGLSEQQVICNSWVNGSWESEIKPPQCPFLPGMKFILKIYYQEDGFVVFEHDTFLVGLPLRLPYPPVIDTVLVEGDVNIHSIKIRSTPK